MSSFLQSDLLQPINLVLAILAASLLSVGLNQAFRFYWLVYKVRRYDRLVDEAEARIAQRRRQP